MVHSKFEGYLLDRGRGKIRIQALRGGTVVEASSFLSDLNAAYAALEHLDLTLNAWRYQKHYLSRRFPPDMWMGMLNPFFANATGVEIGAFDLAPSSQLELTKVRINSPGIWEFLGQINPLQQLREYLNDRHERRKDREYREAAEKRRLDLENEALITKICREQIDAIREESSVLREFGVSEQQLQQFVWQKIGRPLVRLGEHQDTLLIGRVLNENEKEDQSFPK